MTIEEDTLLGPLREQLERLNRAGEGVRA